MKTQTLVLSILTAGFITAPTFAAQAQGCCGPGMSMSGCSGMGAMSGMDMSGHSSPATQPGAVASKLPQPAATVFEKYSKVQTALANDSLQGVAENALAIAQAVKGDPLNTFRAAVAEQAESLAKAADLAAARDAFKALSQALIEYSSENPQVAGLYRQVHCSMANADWLQTDSVVNNPYLGKAMAQCGAFVNAGNGEQNSQPSDAMPGMKM